MQLATYVWLVEALSPSTLLLNVAFVHIIKNTLSVTPFGPMTCNTNYRYKIVSPSMLIPKAYRYSLICFNYIVFSFFTLTSDSWLFYMRGSPLVVAL